MDWTLVLGQLATPVPPTPSLPPAPATPDPAALLALYSAVIQGTAALLALYSAVIQGTATIVAVIGGFLLTYGLGRAAEIRRMDRLLRQVGERQAAIAADLGGKGGATAAGAAAAATGASLLARLVTGDLSREQYRDALRGNLEALEGLARDGDEAGETLRHARHDMDRTARGVMALVALTFAGIVLPAGLMLDAAAGRGSWRAGGWVIGFLMIALTLVLLSIMEVAMVSGWEGVTERPRPWWIRLLVRLADPLLWGIVFVLVVPAVLFLVR